MTIEDLVLLPPPRQIKGLPGHCPCAGPPALPEGLLRTQPGMADTLAAVLGQALCWPVITYSQDATLPPEGYRFTVAPERVYISHATPAGAFYALLTLGQMLLQTDDGALPCCQVEDAPFLPVRGVFLDVARGKVPALGTLKQMADRLALMKYNHLQLYFEGFAFAYPSFPKVWAEQTPLTPAEVKELEAYCHGRFIELVPAQNCLGHMNAWLQLPQYAHLAELDSGVELSGLKLPPATLNPEDEGSFTLAAALIDDVSAAFTAADFNACLDEPFELGMGRCEAACSERGLGQVYLDFVLKVHEHVAARGKRMLMWADVAGRHPETLARLPKDIVLLEWGYEAEYPFEKNAESIRDVGLDFWLCPGTNSWSTYGGNTDGMLQNVRHAAATAAQYGASGLLMTDWGDGGHQQYLPISYAGFAFAAAYAWNRNGMDETTLAGALSTLIYRDEAGVMGPFSLELGRFMRYEECLLPCRTVAFLLMMAGLVNAPAFESMTAAFVGGLPFFMGPELAALYQRRFEERKAFDYENQRAFFDELEIQLKAQKMRCVDAALVQAEYQNTIDMLRLLETAHAFSLHGGADTEAQAALLPELVRLAAKVARGHTAVWRVRNKSYGLEQSTAPFLRIGQQAKALMQ